ncbi:histone-lysine N-methyltransferase SETMAR [Nephila pilipes]|uniref:Histone-lysine N-methyltransferase SETMAR n=1 Tax=Nephila pilipes TaxID=299642 RepID=A0A8X6UW15_NEPPI|nr:histone-lysine N-methyltransferase SETMAR [Nephila pilipes]
MEASGTDLQWYDFNSRCTLKKLLKAIRNIQPGLLSQQVILLHDKSRPHVSLDALTTKHKCRWEVLEHPAYYADLLPSDCRILSLLKKSLQEKRFHTYDEMKQAVHNFRKQPQSFYTKGVGLLPKR